MVICLQPENALAPSLINDFGNSIAPHKLSQYQNAESSITCNDSGNEIILSISDDDGNDDDNNDNNIDDDDDDDVDDAGRIETKFLQSRNAPSWMIFTVDGNVMSVNDVQEEKAR